MTSILAMLVATILSATLPSDGQTVDHGIGSTAPSIGSGVCVAHAVAASIGDRPFYALVSADDLPAFQRLGFNAAVCPTLLTAQRYRDAVCAMAAYGDAAVQNQFARQIGATPAMLCASARRLFLTSDIEVQQ